MKPLTPGILLLFFGPRINTSFRPHTYTAPFYEIDYPHKPLPNCYKARLHDNYTLEQHWHAIGLDLSHKAEFKREHQFNAYELELMVMDEDQSHRYPYTQKDKVKTSAYNVKVDNLDQLLHSKIRHDPGVKWTGKCYWCWIGAEPDRQDPSPTLHQDPHKGDLSLCNEFEYSWTTGA